MSPELLASVGGVVLSLAFSYIPGLDTWYAALDGKAKRLVMLGVLFATALAVFGLSCAKLWVSVTCDQAGAIELVKAFIMAMVANQATFLMSPRSERLNKAQG